MIKKIIIFLFLLVSFIEGYSQGFPYKQPYGNKQTLVYSKGLQGADSAFVFIGSYADTTAANNGGTKSFAGAVIRTSDDKLWLRNNTTTAWVSFGGLDSTNTVAVKNISDLRAINYHTFSSLKKSSNDKPYITVLGYTTPGDGGESIRWYDDTCTAADDGGYYIKPTSVSGAGRWRILVINETIDVKQYGLSETNTGSDNRSRMMNLLSFAKNNPSICRRIFINKGNYPLSDSLLINFSVEIDGVGSGYDGSGFSLSANKKGVRIVDGKADLSNLFFSGSGSDSSKNGITINAEVSFYNVKAIGFGGSGFYIYGDGLDTPPSNTDHSRFVYCFSESNGVHGFHTQGGDANIITFDQCEARDNRAGGFIESGFLGNHYVNCHSVGNSQWNTGFPRSLAKYGGVVYQALQTGFLGRPDLDPTRWYTDAELATWTVSSVIPNFDSARYFFIGGAYNMDGENALTGENQFSVVENCYSEGGMPRSYAGNSVLVFGGDHGTPFRAGTVLKSFNKNFHIRGNGLIVGLNVFDSIYTQVSKLGFILGKNANNINAGVGVEHDVSADIFKFRDVAAYGSGATISNPFSIGGYTSTAATWGRTDNEQRGALMIKDFILFRNVNTASDYKLFSFHTIAPTTGNNKRGDFRLYAEPTSSASPLGFRDISSGSPGTWDTLWAVPSGGTTGQVLSKNSNTPGDLTWSTSSGGGTVNSGTQYQLGYYATTGTTISGNSSITTNANNKLSVSSSDAEPLTVNTTNTSGISGSGFYAIRLGASGMTNGQVMQYMIGKDDNTNNRYAIDFNYASTGSTGNSMGFGFYGNNNLMKLFATGNLSIGSPSDIGVKLFNNGTAHFAGNSGFGTLTLTSLVNIGSNAEFQVNSSGNIVKLNNITTSFPSSQGSNLQLLMNDGSGNLTWNGAETTYTPTLTNTTNVTASTAYTTYYKRIGNWVTVWGEVDIDATAATTISEMGFSLPVASAIANTYDIAGNAAFEDNTCVQIVGDVTNDRAKFRFTPQSATNNKYSFHFSYKVL